MTQSSNDDPPERTYEYICQQRLEQDQQLTLNVPENLRQRISQDKFNHPPRDGQPHDREHYDEQISEYNEELRRWNQHSREVIDYHASVWVKLLRWLMTCVIWVYLLWCRLIHKRPSDWSKLPDWISRDRVTDLVSHSTRITPQETQRLMSWFQQTRINRIDETYISHQTWTPSSHQGEPDTHPDVHPDVHIGECAVNLMDLDNYLLENIFSFLPKGQLVFIRGTNRRLWKLIPPIDVRPYFCCPPIGCDTEAGCVILKKSMIRDGEPNGNGNIDRGQILCRRENERLDRKQYMGWKYCKTDDVIPSVC